MTLTETLERLAVVAGDFIENQSEFLDSWKFKMVGVDEHIRKSSLNVLRWQIFGAICEKCEAEGWRWSLPNTGAKYSFVIWGTGINTPPHGLSENHPAHAAAQALLAALESRVQDCDACDGKGRIYGDMGYCPTCYGTGKQQQAKEVAI